MTVITHIRVSCSLLENYLKKHPVSMHYDSQNARPYSSLNELLDYISWRIDDGAKRLSLIGNKGLVDNLIHDREYGTDVCGNSTL